MTRTTRPGPRSAADEVIQQLQRQADPGRAASNQRYFKEPVKLYGLDTPTCRGMTRDLLRRVKGFWTVREAVAFCRAMVRDPHLEARGIGFEVVAAFVGEAGPDLLQQARHWLERSCGNWALVDNLAPGVVTPLIARHPGIIPDVVAWTSADSMWVRRGAAVAFVPLARSGRHLDSAYEVARRLVDDPEDLMHKAVGWMLREAGRTDRPRLRRFLRSEGSRMARTTVRYAIEHFPAGERKRLLQETR